MLFISCVFNFVWLPGLISVDDFVVMLREMGEPLTHDDVQHLLQEIEIDGDNKINIKEFVQHMSRTSTHTT